MLSNLGNRLKSTLRRGNEEYDDPENEESSHVANALRSYYIENSQPFPPWLTPDPKGRLQSPTPPPPLAMSQSHSSTPEFHGGRRSEATPRPSFASANAAPAGYGSTGGGSTGGGGGGGLSDLWGDSGSSQRSPQTTSLRSRRAPDGGGGGSGSVSGGSGSAPPPHHRSHAAPPPSHSSSPLSRFQSSSPMHTTTSLDLPMSARPNPRTAGSTASPASGGSGSTGGGGGGGSAQERLRARLKGFGHSS